MSLIIAIIGRPNVGKSTLFNRLVGKKLALVDDQPGVTRDRRYGDAYLAGLTFTVIDTAGMASAAEDALETRMLAQTRAGMAEADAILFVIDARIGVTPEDERFATEARKSGRKVILVANKAEGKAGRLHVADFYAMGFGDPVLLSAEHGEGFVDLYDALAPLEGMHDAQDDRTIAVEEEVLTELEIMEEDDEASAPVTLPGTLQIAIVGRPNAGKSTLINALLGEDRLLVGPEAGITRDSIALPFEHNGQVMKLVDTAGMRKRANVQAKLEKMAVGDSLRAIRYAHVVVVLLDATAPLEKQDAQIAALIEREGRACVIGLNKWDLVKKGRQAYLEELRHMLNEQLSQMQNIALVPCSAIHGDGIANILQAAVETYRIWNKRVPTGALNRWLEGVVAHHSPPLVRGRRLKIKYMTQIKTRPPTFQLHCNMDKEFPDAYLRYLVSGLRQSFEMPGVPIRFQLKASSNPFVKKK